jgi:hypothetical protein
LFSLIKTDFFSFVISRENLINDVYLQSQMDTENYVPISIIANFKLVKRLTNDLQLIIDVLKGEYMFLNIKNDFFSSRITIC